MPRRSLSLIIVQGSDQTRLKNSLCYEYVKSCGSCKIMIQWRTLSAWLRESINVDKVMMDDLTAKPIRWWNKVSFGCESLFRKMHCTLSCFEISRRSDVSPSRSLHERSFQRIDEHFDWRPTSLSHKLKHIKDD